MTDLAELLAAIIGDEEPSDDNIEPWLQLSGAFENLTIDDGHLLLNAVSSPLIVPDWPFEPHRCLVLHAVAANPVGEYVEKLEHLGTSAPTYARPQVVRSLFEIAARAPSQVAADTGLRLVGQLLEADELVLTERDDPFYWLIRSTPFPETVLPWLPAFAVRRDLRRHMSAIQSAYEAAGHPLDGAARAQVSLDHEDIERLAASEPGRLASALIEAIEARTGAMNPTARFEAIAGMPDVLVTTWAAWWVEAEVSNGGFNQYFWNSAGDFALPAVDAFARLGRNDLADLLRAAVLTLQESENELLPFQQDASLEAFSASYELQTFEHLDQRFSELTDTDAISDTLHDYLKERVGEVADALAS